MDNLDKRWIGKCINWLKKIWAKFNHNVAARSSNINIADNYHYKQSLKDNFGVESLVIRYGGDHVKKIPTSRKELLKKYPFADKKYAVSVSRAQLDNNLHLVLACFESFLLYPLVLISNWNVSAYGKKLYETDNTAFKWYAEKTTSQVLIYYLDLTYTGGEKIFQKGNITITK